IVLLDALPLTVSGKVDRRALPEPAREDVVSGLGIVESESAPDADFAGEAERILAEIFPRVLGTGPLGRDAPFFRLGGDSILAIQVVAGAREAGLSLAPSLLFEHP